MFALARGHGLDHRVSDPCGHAISDVFSPRWLVRVDISVTVRHVRYGVCVALVLFNVLAA